ncbi:1-acyl-sn-glycerol-3-phosphate acyltransferase [Paenibacillus castaneae]|uniref:lysophospholipid acyltransferase family protein n=1 Tax=Paenibacillus castaneae TaxID=474957 RepID=UPI000C9B9D88|nr:lysophospholipid acyltransferase family protein [Paenibacillus castaneae]NIK76021.1 1-acyl-sn-glycerol-3-phosphate acyltransferase [Paenibacillus castaneae]
MIEASKSRWFDRLFLKYNESYLLRKHFHNVGLHGELDPYPDRSVLYIMNHSSWWDGLILYQAFRTRSEGDHYVMMDEEQMQHFRFFRKLGVFSIQKKSPQSMISSLRYTVSLLNAGKRVWIFPQGDIQHLEQRPLQLKDGAAHVLKQCPQTVVVPITAYYSLFHHQKAEATLLAGLPIAIEWDKLDKKAITSKLEAVLERQLDEHRFRSMSGDPSLDRDFTMLVRKGGSTSEAFTAFKRRLGKWKSFFGR